METSPIRFSRRKSVGGTILGRWTNVETVSHTLNIPYKVNIGINDNSISNMVTLYDRWTHFYAVAYMSMFPILLYFLLVWECDVMWVITVASVRQGSASALHNKKFILLCWRYMMRNIHQSYISFYTLIHILICIWLTKIVPPVYHMKIHRDIIGKRILPFVVSFCTECLNQWQEACDFLIVSDTFMTKWTTGRMLTCLNIR